MPARCYRLDSRGEEAECPGFSETRRSVLICTSALMASLLASPGRLLAALDDEEDPGALSAFIEGTSPEATRLKVDNSPEGQEKYIRYIASAAESITTIDDSGLGEESWKGLDPGVFLGFAGRNRAFFVVHWKLAPHAVLPAHCHPETSVCTLGIEGFSSLRHFRTAPGAPSYRDDRETLFRIFETRRLELHEGTISTLTEHRDNIHHFEAGPKGSRGIDITTSYGGDGSFSFLDFDPQHPVDGGTRAYEARWSGQTPPGG